jgi:flavin reductase (DIM6/NTAB) family NADH-FMN oxidoreductase RutF
MLSDLAKDPTQWFPMPAALVTSRDEQGRANLMGIGYVGFTCWRPPILYLGMNTARHSGKVIQQTGEFVVSLPDPAHVLHLDYCGFVSGADCDKFAAAGLSTRQGVRVAAPLINECPVNLECRLQQVIILGSHDLYLGEVVETHLDRGLVEGQQQLTPIILVSRRYMAASHFMCDFGSSNGCPPA